MTIAANDYQVIADVLIVGYTSIKQKYIQQVAVADFASEGLKGLSSIDPMLAISTSRSKVTLTYDGEPKTEIFSPNRNDIAGWVTLTITMIERGQRVSEPLRWASDEIILEALFDGALSNLDIFSRYAGRDEARDNRAKRDGFGGIGIQFKRLDGHIVITDVMPETPAALAGLEVGDMITGIDGNPVQGQLNRDISNQLRGPINSEVTVRIARKADYTAINRTMNRAHIIPKTVFTSYRNGVLTARVTNFNENTTRSLNKALEDAITSHDGSFKGVVLDLRGNPGGKLKQAIFTANLFMSEGQIISTRGRHKDAAQGYSASGQDVIEGRPLIVLLDGKSASAAEVTAATLQDHGRATVLGTTSYGKGSVQNVVVLPNTGEMTLTWSHLVAPSGYTFHGLGLLPSLCTSGVEKSLSDTEQRDLANPEMRQQMLAQLIKTRKTKVTAKAWRTPTIEDHESRVELRKVCPPEQRNRRSLDMALAHYLIEDPHGYSHSNTYNLEAAAAE